MRRSVQAMEKGNYIRARKHGYLLLEEIRQLHAADSGNHENIVVEANALYNMAGIEDHLGQTAVAIECARKAMGLYADLGVTGTPAEIALAAGLQAIVAGLAPPPGLPPLVELAVSMADTRARLARLMAKELGPAAAQEVHTLARDAVEICERLVTTELADMAALRYVVEQYAVAREILVRGYLIAGERDRAFALYQDVLADLEQVLGASHPATAALRTGLTAFPR